MSEYKFRAWDNKTKEMLEVSEAIFINGEIADYHATGDQAISGWRGGDTVMQFSGLQDKNGKDIYESDIVQIYQANYDVPDNPDVVITKDYVGTVLFEDGQFKNTVPGYTAETLIVNRLDDTDGQVLRLVEVIGNLYENKELLNV